MNGNAELLNFIYQNSQMGVDTIKQLLDITDDEKLKSHLRAQLSGYQDIHYKAQKMLNANGFDEKGISAFDKIKTYMMVNFQTLNDRSASHIAEMLILGGAMGIVDAIKNIRKYTDAEHDIVSLMEELKSFEEDNSQKLRAFL